MRNELTLRQQIKLAVAVPGLYKTFIQDVTPESSKQASHNKNAWRSLLGLGTKALKNRKIRLGGLLAGLGVVGAYGANNVGFPLNTYNPLSSDFYGYDYDKSKHLDAQINDHNISQWAKEDPNNRGYDRDGKPLLINRGSRLDRNGKPINLNSNLNTTQHRATVDALDALHRSTLTNTQSTPSAGTGSPTVLGFPKDYNGHYRGGHVELNPNPKDQQKQYTRDAVHEVAHHAHLSSMPWYLRGWTQAKALLSPYTQLGLEDNASDIHYNLNKYIHPDSYVSDEDQINWRMANLGNIAGNNREAWERYYKDQGDPALHQIQGRPRNTPHTEEWKLPKNP